MAIDRTVVDRGEGTAVVLTHGSFMDHTMFAPTIERNPELVAHWVARWRKLPARSAYNEVQSWLGKADNRPELANIDVPALILHGEEDSIFPVSVAEEIEAGIPRARLVVVPLAGHTANLEQPELCNEAILDFLS